MRKIFLFLLSVIILSTAGCGKKDIDVSTETKATEVAAKDTSETESIKATEEATETEVTEAVTEEPKTDNEEEEDTQTANEDSKANASEQSDNNQNPVSNQSSSNEQSADANQGHDSTPQQSEQTPAPEPEPTPEPTPQPETQVINYSPENVVALATAKTKAAGKVLLTENLDNLLANGQITQEEYNEYYPYDGAGYYSVFVDSNMAEARSVSGTTSFHSEDEIAQYISDMLVLETGPYFLIEYAGIYDYYGKICYEFRCYRA